MTAESFFDFGWARSVDFFVASPEGVIQKSQRVFEMGHEKLNDGGSGQPIFFLIVKMKHRFKDGSILNDRKFALHFFCCFYRVRVVLFFLGDRSGHGLSECFFLFLNRVVGFIGTVKKRLKKNESGVTGNCVSCPPNFSDGNIY